MKNYELVVAEACRIEVDETTGRTFIIFEIKNEKFKNEIKKNWAQDIEYKLIGKNLVKNE